MSLINTEDGISAVEWLYGELDVSEAKRFEERLKADPTMAAEVAELQTIRSLANELQDIEPPDSLHAIVMHEAGRQAESLAKPSVWSRLTWFWQPVRMHPAISAMATLLLVGGVAGVLHNRHGEAIVAKPVTQSMAPAPLDSSAFDSELQETDSSRADSERGAEEEASRPSVSDEHIVDILSAERQDALGEVMQSAKSEKTSSENNVKDARALRKTAKEVRRRSYSAPSSPPSPSSKRMADGITSPVRESNGQVGALFGNRGADDERSEQNGDFAAAQEQKPKKVSQQGSDTRSRLSATPTSWAERQVLRFVVAAETMRCQEAGRIANDIRDRSPKFYEDMILGRSEERQCQKAIVAERNRRRAGRDKKSKPMKAQ